MIARRPSAAVVFAAIVVVVFAFGAFAIGTAIGELVHDTRIRIEAKP